MSQGCRPYGRGGGGLSFAPINPVTGQRWPDGGNTGYQNEPNFNTTTQAQIAGTFFSRAAGTLHPHPNNGGNIFPGPGTYQYIFFDTGGATVNIQSSGTYTFIGCQFCQYDPTPSSSNGCMNITAGTVSLSYCSFTPRPAQVVCPFGGTVAFTGGGYSLWPSAGAQNSNSNAGSSTYNNFCVANQYEFALNYNGTSAGNCTADRCDFWGGTNFVNITHTSATGSVSVTNSWVHDACNDSPGPNQSHVDGIGMESDSGSQTNVVVQYCTVGSIGNTQGLAYQGGSGSTYTNMTVVGNYLTGFGATTAFKAATYTSCTITDNVFGTDIGTTRMTDGATITGGQWRRNTIKIIPGTVPSNTSGIGTPMDNPWTSGENGYFLYPANTYNLTDYTG